MTIGWVAPAIRGEALVRRLIGVRGALSLAEADWPGARRALSSSMYGADLPADASRAQARRTAMEATAWQLRVLAGWVPPGRSAIPRLFAAPMEIANIEGRLAEIEGRDSHRPIRLGSLVVVWPRVAAATSAGQIRASLATSVWGDPGGVEPSTISLALRIGLARRLSVQLPQFTDWARGAMAVLVAREQYGFARPINQTTSRAVDRFFGRRWRQASSVSSLRETVPKSAAWPLDGVESAADLWRAELAFVHRVAGDAEHLTARGRYDESTLVGVMALLLVDLWRVLAAVEVAGRRPIPREVFDAVA